MAIVRKFKNLKKEEKVEVIQTITENPTAVDGRTRILLYQATVFNPSVHKADIISKPATRRW